MLKALYQSFDRLAMSAVTRAVAGAGHWPPQIEQARDLLSQDPFFPKPNVPSTIGLRPNGHFSFRSDVRTPWMDNDLVQGWFHRAGPDWKNKPCAILLHGLQGELEYYWKYPWLARRLARDGVNTLAMVLPFHGRRRPRGPGAVTCFLSSHLVATLLAFRQAVSDVRALVGWLRQEGFPAVGVSGVSLGGWLAGMTACVEPALSCAVLTAPVVHMERAFRDLPFAEPIRRNVNEAPADFRRLNLAEVQPLLAPQRILIVESEYDLLAPAETVEYVWERWGRPEIWRLRHGHISVLLSFPIILRTRRWLADQLTKACAD